MTGSRQAGWSIGPIPYDAVSKWARDNDLDPRQREELWYLVEKMDSAYIKAKTPTKGT